MIFASDNWAGVSDRVRDVLAAASSGIVPAYGGDDQTKAVERQFAEIFEREVAVFFVATGTAANALSLAAYSRPGGVVLCHAGAHIVDDEAGAPESLAGCRVRGLPGANGKLAPETVSEALRVFSPAAVYHGLAMAVSISLLTELGTAYSAREIGAIAEVAHGAGLPLHLDGARFASAVAGLGVSPADLTWRVGVDVMSFGGTKGGCWAAEAVIFFDKDAAASFPYLRKRAGQLFSKSRFVAAQFSAYLADGHWLDLARTANQRARDLAAGITASGQGRVPVPVDGCEVFAIIPRERARVLRAAGAVFHDWNPATVGASVTISADEVMVRLVTNFGTAAGDVARFVELLR